MSVANKFPGGLGPHCEEQGKVLGSPAIPGISYARIQVCTPNPQRLSAPLHPPASGVQHLPCSCPGNSPVVPAGTALPAGDVHHPRTRPD